MTSGEPFRKHEHPTFRTGRRSCEVRQVSEHGAEGLLDGAEAGLREIRGPLEVQIRMSTWQKRDWQQFYELARRPWRRHRPPRPVYPSGLNRVAPAQGFSLSELDDAGVDLDLAESLGLPVDAGRIGVYGPNVSVLRDFIRASRPL